MRYFRFRKSYLRLRPHGSCVRLSDFSGLNEIEIYKFIFTLRTEHGYDKGDITSRQFYSEVKRGIKANKDLTYKKFSEIWGDIFFNNPGMEQFLERIKQGRRFLLLSNTNYLHWRYISRMPIIKKHFSDPKRLILSFREHTRKPDQKIFLKAMKKSGFKPHETVFIDDIEDNVNAFRSLGGYGIVYNCRKDSLGFLMEEFLKIAS